MTEHAQAAKPLGMVPPHRDTSRGTIREGTDGPVSEDVAGADGRPSDTGDRLELTWKLVDGPDWDRMAAGFDGICQEQLYAYAHAHWPSARHEALRFSLDDEAVGGCLLMIQPLPLGIGAVAVTKWGPALKNNADPRAPDIYRAIIEILMAEYGERRRMTLSILPKVSCEIDNPEFIALRQMGFTQGPLLRGPARYFVDVRLDDREQRKSIQQKWRNRLNKSERSGLVFERSDFTQLPEFDLLFKAMLARKQYVDHSAYETLPALLRHDVEALRPSLFFARHEGEAVAGAVVFTAGDTATYLFGATGDKALSLNAGHFLQFRVIGWLRDNTKVRWYNLGGDGATEGLAIFKTGLVGSAGMIRSLPPAARYAAHPYPRAVGAAAFAAKELAGNIRWWLDDPQRPWKRRRS